MKQIYIYLAIIFAIFLGLLGHKVFANEPQITILHADYEVIKSEPSTIVLNNTNFAAIRDEVNGATINKALLALTKSDPNKPFYLFLDSPGGDVIAGRRLVSYLHDSKRNIVCVAQTAISMAYVILQSCPVRLVTAHSILMTHQIAGKMEGNLRELQAQIYFKQRLADLYDGIIAARMGLALDVYRTKINPEWWMVGYQEAINNNAADAPVQVRCTTELEKEIETVGQGSDAAKVSKCPIAG
jgi:ATP-dependent Clp protease protease subunit